MKIAVLICFAFAFAKKINPKREALFDGQDLANSIMNAPLMINSDAIKMVGFFKIEQIKSHRENRDDVNRTGIFDRTFIQLSTPSLVKSKLQHSKVFETSENEYFASFETAQAFLIPKSEKNFRKMFESYVVPIECLKSYFHNSQFISAFDQEQLEALEYPTLVLKEIIELPGRIELFNSSNGDTENVVGKSKGVSKSLAFKKHHFIAGIHETVLDVQIKFSIDFSKDSGSDSYVGTIRSLIDIKGNLVTGSRNAEMLKKHFEK